MTNIDREQAKAMTRQSKDLMDVWVRERKEVLAEQLAANADIKQRWLASNPIEVSQQERAYHTNTNVQVSTAVESEPGRSKTVSYE